MKSDDLFRVVGGIFVGMVGLFGLFALVQLISLSPLWSEPGAAWVQAVGSVAALGVAIFVMKKQNETALAVMITADNRATSRRANAVAVMVANTCVHLHVFGSRLRGNIADGKSTSLVLGSAEIAMHPLLASKRLIEATAFYDIGSMEIVSVTLDLLEEVRFAEVLLQSWQSSPEQFDRIYAVKKAEYFVQKSDELYAKYEALRAKLTVASPAKA